MRSLAKDSFVQELIEVNDRLVDRNDCLEEITEQLKAENERLKVELECIQKEIEKLQSEHRDFKKLISDETDVIIKRLSNINGDSFKWVVDKACGREREYITAEKDIVDVDFDFQPVTRPGRVLDYDKLDDRVAGESVSIIKRLAKINETDVDSITRWFFMCDISNTL